jgi:hypothetical protein
MRLRFSQATAFLAVVCLASAARGQAPISDAIITRLPAVDNSMSAVLTRVGYYDAVDSNELLTINTGTTTELTPAATPDGSAGSGACTNGACGNGTCGNGSGCGNSNGCGCCNGSCAACNGCPTHGWTAWSGLDSFKGIADGTGPSNFGAVTGINYGTRLGRFSDVTGIGAQIGGSLGVYDLAGRPTAATGNSLSQGQTQGFFTVGFFRAANANTPWSAGLVHDWMLNNNYGVFGTSPTISQWRGQVAYVWNARNEFGVYGTLRDMGHSEVANLGAPGAPIPTSLIFQSYNQANFFWHHKWEYGADSRIWIGGVQNGKLGTNGGSLGDLILGANLTAPLNDRWAVYGNGQYMFPSAHPGPAASVESAWNLGFGLVWYPRCNARTGNVAGNCWTPYMPVANNSTFLTDTNVTR